MMEAVSTSETSINFYHITRRSVPEDSLHPRHLLPEGVGICSIYSSDTIKITLFKNQVHEYGNFFV
jgi:hypothetical protein